MLQIRDLPREQTEGNILKEIINSLDFWRIWTLG